MFVLAYRNEAFFVFLVDDVCLIGPVYFGDVAAVACHAFIAIYDVEIHHLGVAVGDRAADAPLFREMIIGGLIELHKETAALLNDFEAELFALFFVNLDRFVDEGYRFVADA